ncbi:hypothetical protein HPP92_006476 [Vanilla planifolia]|uniref:Uncharacterized protein n=1 Tax=Vanilla planifolia TaxID=51239 RepID=A0A835RFP7_VANPL|nr:hypothetical protein HPP92_006737 [Vanilla planifolia]KAG0489613.1 hypothetical protein HPP92_006476 [Vanilla planifolia]
MVAVRASSTTPAKCVLGIFDGEDEPLLPFEALDQLYDEQLNGVNIVFVYNDVHAPNTLRKIGTSASVIERLLEW